MRKFTAALFMICVAFGTRAQSDDTPYVKPKLVVGIVVDQMRYDYLTRFWERYGDGGFKRLINEGFNCKNNHFNYIPTYTGPGHTSVYTGTTQLRGKVIGVAIKDRGAILPAGHAANAAYWFHGKDEGKWITSSYYMDKLPEWVEKFNNSGKAKEYMTTWNTLYDIDTYVESGPDDNPYEGKFKGEKTPTFPHELKKLEKYNGGYDLLKSTPYGNNITTDFALAAIDGEDLGKDDITDFLTLSYSCTDYVGHKFGVNSKEAQDTYLRLDKDLARLLSELDKKVGKGEYTVFLTADHGAVHVPSYLQSLKIPGGYFNILDFTVHVKNFAKEKYGVDGLISNISNNQIFIDHKVAKEHDLNIRHLQEDLVEEIMQYKDVEKAYTASAFVNAEFTERLTALLQRGYNQKRSGDVLYVLAPSVIVYSKTGSTHGSGLNYDTHAPFLLYGKGIKKGESTEKETHINDIAPTISALLGIAFPSGATGRPVFEAMEIED